MGAVMPNWLFKKQAQTGPESKKCAYYALYHFKNGNITWDKFLAAGIKYYMKELKLDTKDAMDFVEDGNDPGILNAFGLSEYNLTSLRSHDVLIVAQYGTGVAAHFYTIRRIGGSWFSYDSFNLNAPDDIGDDAAAKIAIGNHKYYAAAVNTQSCCTIM